MVKQRLGQVGCPLDRAWTSWRVLLFQCEDQGQIYNLLDQSHILQHCPLVIFGLIELNRDFCHVVLHAYWCIAFSCIYFHWSGSLNFYYCLQLMVTDTKGREEKQISSYVFVFFFVQQTIIGTLQTVHILYLICVSFCITAIFWCTHKTNAMPLRVTKSCAKCVLNKLSVRFDLHTC